MKTLKTKARKVNRAELEEKVKAMYRKAALHPKVQYHFEMGRGLAERLGYGPQILDQIPASSIDSFAGVGYHFDLANLSNGEAVVDLGSGSGMDAFYAARQIGATGEVIGIDMTDEQLKKSEQLKQRGGFYQVHFIESYIEQLPIISNSVDVVISNGVINLSSQKKEVFKEAGRILKTGGRMAISDIVSSVPLPENITCNATLWAACIGGAMEEQSYLDLIARAGLKVKEVNINPYRFLSNSAQGATQTYGIKSISILAVK